MDIFKALKMAIRSEIAAQRMYTKLAREVYDQEAKSLFDYLAEYETRHQQFLEAERKALVATQGNSQGKPSHWLKLLREEIQAGLEPEPSGLEARSTSATADSGLAQCRLDLSAAESIARILKDANDELSLKQARYERELEIAADIQRKLLPEQLPQDTGLQIAASNVMARSVGGDYYDFITNEKDQLALVVADSMGKGMPAALLMTTVRAIWRGCLVAGSKPPGQALETINRVLYPDLKTTQSFVTMFGALYDPETSVFQYSNAGHNPPLFRPASAPECRELDIGGTPVGIFSDSEFPNGEFLMRKGDIVVIYTDGVVEATDENDILFGFERLCGVVDRNHSSDAEDVKSTILSEVDSYADGSSQADDITIVVLKKV